MAPRTQWCGDVFEDISGLQAGVVDSEELVDRVLQGVGDAQREEH